MDADASNPDGEGPVPQPAPTAVQPAQATAASARQASEGMNREAFLSDLESSYLAVRAERDRLKSSAEEGEAEAERLRRNVAELRAAVAEKDGELDVARRRADGEGNKRGLAEEAMRMADEIALMRAGKIVQRGAPYNIYNAPRDKEAVGFFSDINVIDGVVRGALTDTPFGQFLAPGVPDGQAVEIVIRPQHFKIDFDRDGRGPDPTPSDGAAARGVVEHARFMGNESLVEFRMDHDGSKLRVTVPNVFLPSVGKALWLSIRRDRCFVFPKVA